MASTISGKLIRKFIRKLVRLFEKESFALDNLDKKLASYITKRNGFFIEVGANDGVSQSNTLYFEKYLGWTGLLIEAIPELAEKCKRNRPKCIVENCALVSRDYPYPTVTMWYCNLMSVVEDPRIIPRDRLEAYIQSGLRFLRKDERPYRVTVPARTLSDVLDAHKIEKVDLLVLDVEGYEAEVLKGLDFRRHRPVFILVEVRSREEIEAILRPYYREVAVLTCYPEYQDILYVLT